MSGLPGEPRWVSQAAVTAIHADQVRQHGGAQGLRDAGLLASALHRPRNRWHYETGTDLCGLAAAYGYGLARNHPFVDGNKRVALLTMYVFLGLNGIRLEAPEPAVVALMVGVADGTVDETALAGWLRKHTLPG